MLLLGNGMGSGRGHIGRLVPKIAAMTREAKHDVLAFRVFPKAHW
jgi:hypothetical protein